MEESQFFEPAQTLRRGLRMRTPPEAWRKVQDAEKELEAAENEVYDASNENLSGGTDAAML